MNILLENPLLKPVLSTFGVQDSFAVVSEAATFFLYNVCDIFNVPVELQRAVDFPPVLSLLTSALVVSLTTAITWYLMYSILDALVLKYFRSGIYIVDVACFNSYRPEWCILTDDWFARAATTFNISEENIEWSRKILARSGVGDKTHFSPGIAMNPPDLSIAAARYEAEVVMFDCVDQLLKKNNLKPRDIDVLVVNCSLFNPTPSLAAMIINHYAMRDDIITYNLSGLGCSASPLAIQLAGDVLMQHEKRDPIAIVISTENITQNIYTGSDKAMMVSNVLFRMGGAGVLLSRNRLGWGGRPNARYQVTNMVRLHMGSNETAYRAVFQDADKENKIGVRLSKDQMKVASVGLTKNQTKLGPQILPYMEQLKYGFNELVRRWRIKQSPELAETLKPAVPNFKTAIDHFCIHAGGRAVIDAIQKALDLTDEDVKPSRDVLYKYGNVSSASIWYELQNIEENRNPKSGEKVCLLAFGSGMKFNSMMLKKL